MSDVTLDVMTFAKLDFTLEKWGKGEFDVGRNYLNRGITVYIMQWLH